MEWTDVGFGNVTIAVSCRSRAISQKWMLSVGGVFSAICRSCEDTLDGDMGAVDSWGVPMTMERGMGSMASLDGTLRKGAPTLWREPELPEVIAMLNYRLDPVKTNAAAFLQHLTFKNDKVRIVKIFLNTFLAIVNNPWCVENIPHV